MKIASAFSQCQRRVASRWRKIPRRVDGACMGSSESGAADGITLISGDQREALQAQLKSGYRAFWAHLARRECRGRLTAKCTSGSRHGPAPKIVAGAEPPARAVGSLRSIRKAADPPHQRGTCFEPRRRTYCSPWSLEAQTSAQNAAVPQPTTSSILIAAMDALAQWSAQALRSADTNCEDSDGPVVGSRQ